MKKFLSLFLICVFMLSLSGCTAKIDPVGEIEKKPGSISESIIGTWEIAEADFENDADPFKKVMTSLLKDYMKKGSKVIFEEGNKAVVDDTNVEYALNANILTLTWDNSKNFTFEISFDDGRLELEADDVAEFKLKK